MLTERQKEYKRQYRQRDYVKAQTKQYKEKRKNTDAGLKDKLQQREYYKLHKEDRIRNANQWKTKNKDKVRTHRLNSYNKRKLSPLLNLSDRLRGAIKHTLKRRGILKSRSTFKLLGYSAEKLFECLGKYLHQLCEECKCVILVIDNSDIDHIIPISSAVVEEDVVKLNQLHNLRLICHKCNLRKSNNVINT